jgi:mono/diheme cytochrome c family protein
MPFPRWLAACALLMPLAAPATAGDKLEYNRDIRPILSENCFACHGADGAARKAKLRLDVRDSALDKGAIVPGKPDDSELVYRLNLASDDESLMPPPDSHKKLTAEQTKILERWVKEGAEYQPHWAFVAPKMPAVPAVKTPGWVKNPIDAFVLKELERRNLSPAPEADRRTLARRVALDATGLPPTPADVEAFVNDKSADAYEKYVDKMLASPHYGEHRGRYWLDAARYGDTHGIHFDNYREMWSYRDWVFKAFNANKPFDEFTVEQLAGDLMPKPTMDQMIATGFNRCNITTNEGGAISEEYLVLYTRDRTDAANTIWLGLTTGCAVCHDHKYDPISQKEFYSLSAFFNNTVQGAMDGNRKDTPPIIFVPAAPDRVAWDKLDAQISSAKADLERRKATARPVFQEWVGETKPTDILAAAPEKGLVFRADLNAGKGTKETVTFRGKKLDVELPKGTTWKPGPFAGKVAFTKPTPGGPGAIDFPAGVGDSVTADKPYSYGAWVQIPQRNQTAAVFAKMDEADGHRGWDLWVENGRFAAHLIDAWPNKAIKVTSKDQFDTTKWHHVFVTYDGSKKAAGLKLFVDGQPQPVNFAAEGVANDPNKVAEIGTVQNKVPLTVGRRTPGSQLKAVAVGDLRIYDRELNTNEVQSLGVTPRIAAYLAAKPADRKPAETDAVFDWWISTADAQSQQLSERLRDLRQEETNYRARGTIAHVSTEKPTPPEAFVLDRGEYDRRGTKVAPTTPASLPPMPADLPKNRYGYAQWLLRPENPLTARVTVNRFWSELFGLGLVRTAGDFGIAGELPSHPDLLDWLALDFRDHKWDVKRFFKQVMLSNTYRQSAVATQDKLDVDPANTYLSRGPRFRMDAEMIRDYALKASGLMVEKIGGPSVRPYQPGGVWEAVAMPGSDTRVYVQDTGENLYRRSVYTFWKRAAPPASMEIFNAPNRETCTVRRDRTNTPLQALVTLNDTQFVEAARHLAQAAMASSPATPARIDFLSATILARPFTTEEKAVVTAAYDDLLKHYKQRPEDAKKLIAVGDSKADAKLDPADLAACTMVVNQLLNLDEALCK